MADVIERYWKALADSGSGDAQPLSVANSEQNASKPDDILLVARKIADLATILNQRRQTATQLNELTLRARKLAEGARDLLTSKWNTEVRAREFAKDVVRFALAAIEIAESGRRDTNNTTKMATILSASATWLTDHANRWRDPAVKILIRAELHKVYGVVTETQTQARESEHHTKLVHDLQAKAVALSNKALVLSRSARSLDDVATEIHREIVAIHTLIKHIDQGVFGINRKLVETTGLIVNQLRGAAGLPIPEATPSASRDTVVWNPVPSSQRKPPGQSVS